MAAKSVAAKCGRFLPCPQLPKSAIFSRDQLLVVPLLSIAAYTWNRTLLSFQNYSAFCPEQWASTIWSLPGPLTALIKAVIGWNWLPTKCAWRFLLRPNLVLRPRILNITLELRVDVRPCSIIHILDSSSLLRAQKLELSGFFGECGSLGFASHASLFSSCGLQAAPFHEQAAEDRKTARSDIQVEHI